MKPIHPIGAVPMGRPVDGGPPELKPQRSGLPADYTAIIYSGPSRRQLLAMMESDEMFGRFSVREWVLLHGSEDAAEAERPRKEEVVPYIEKSARNQEAVNLIAAAWSLAEEQGNHISRVICLLRDAIKVLERPAGLVTKDEARKAKVA